MALPASFATITVTGTYVDFHGNPASGTVTFSPPSGVFLKSTPGDVMIVPKPVVATLDAEGHFEVVLPVTDDPDVVPVFKYTVLEIVTALRRSYDVELPAALLPGPVDLSDLAPAGTVTAGTTALTRTLADALYAPLGGGGAVESVNGETGAVVLSAADVGAAPEGDYATTTALSEGLATKVNASTYTAGLAEKVDTDTADATYAPLTRRVTAVSSLSSTEGSTLGNVECAFRYPDMLPYKPARWRLRIRNWQNKAETAVTSGAIFEPVYVGAGTIDANGASTAAFTTAPAQALPGFTLPADGSEYVSEWVTDPSLCPPPNALWLYSFGFTGGATQASGNGQMFYRGGAGTATSNALATGSGYTVPGSILFDTRIEYEADVPAQTPVVLTVGDSLTRGGGPGRVPSWQAWPNQYALRSRRVVSNAGIGGTTLAEWSVSTAFKWTRCAGTAPDIITIGLGTNELSASATLATMQSSFLGVVTAARTLYPDAVLIALPLWPRSSPHTRLATALASGVTTIYTTETASNGTWQIGEGRSLELVTVTGATGPDAASGRYTVTLSAATTKAHGVGEVVAGTQETTRLNFNAWLRGLPGRIQGVLNIDRALAFTQDPSVLAPEFSHTDNLHLTNVGYVSAAAAVIL